MQEENVKSGQGTKGGENKTKNPHKTIDKEGPLWVMEQVLSQVRSETQSTIDSSRCEV